MDFRLYAADELGDDGYPLAWHGLGDGDRFALKDLVREAAGNRCVRCGHPYTKGQHGDGEWSPCGEHCRHGGPVRVWSEFGRNMPPSPVIEGPFDVGESLNGGFDVDAQWRILTVHHLDGDKANCRWWNLASLCQRCHLQIQGRVQIARIWPWEHSAWFQPYVAGYYAFVYLGEDLTRPEVEERLDELLALERVA